jgi:hypothetical protein
MNPFSKSYRRVVFAIASGVRSATRRGSLSAMLIDTYRPELHYMRGPGPKWQEKRAHTVELAR